MLYTYFILTIILIVPTLYYVINGSRFIYNSTCKIVYWFIFVSFLKLCILFRIYGIPKSFDDLLVHGGISEFNYLLLNYSYLCTLFCWVINSLIFLICTPYNYYINLKLQYFIQRSGVNTLDDIILHQIYRSSPNICYDLLIRYRFITDVIPMLTVNYTCLHYFFVNENDDLFLYINGSSAIIYFWMCLSEFIIFGLYTIPIETNQSGLQSNQGSDVHRD